MLFCAGIIGGKERKSAMDTVTMSFGADEINFCIFKCAFSLWDGLQYDL